MLSDVFILGCLRYEGIKFAYNWSTSMESILWIIDRPASRTVERNCVAAHPLNCATSTMSSTQIVSDFFLILNILFSIYTAN